MRRRFRSCSSVMPRLLSTSSPGTVARLTGVRRVYLLKHALVVAALRGGLEVPGDLDDLALELAVLDGDETGALGRDQHDLAVPDQLDRARLLDECRCL